MTTARDLGYPSITQGLKERDSHLDDLGLGPHVLDLERWGYTVVPDVIGPDVVEALAEELCDLAATDAGTPVDRATGASHQDRTQEVVLLFARGSERLRGLVVDDRALALVRYLLGESCVLSSCTGYVKGPGRCELGVHSDTAYVPDPLPPYAQLANVNVLLSDYTADAGPITMVPGSHRYCHRPRDGHGAREAVPVLAGAGSAVVFHGNTWHGALPREAKGVRLTLSLLYARFYMRTQEDYAAAMAADEVAAMPPSLRGLVAPTLPTGWRSLDEASAILARRRDDGARWYRTRSTHA